MFKKKCGRCNRKIEKDFDFCPYCGKDFRIERNLENQRDFGFLGKEDLLNEFQNLDIKMPLGLDSIFNSVLREVDKQFKEIDKEIPSEVKPNSGISISISTSPGKKPQIKVNSFGKNVQLSEKKQENRVINEEEARKLSKLPKKEAETKVRRLSNKIVYEINLPGVNSIENVLINKLENSIEIKAFSKDKAYFKLLPIKLPILNYKLQDSKLILELKA